MITCDCVGEWQIVVPVNKREYKVTIDKISCEDVFIGAEFTDTRILISLKIAFFGEVALLNYGCCEMG